MTPQAPIVAPPLLGGGGGEDHPSCKMTPPPTKCNIYVSLCYSGVNLSFAQVYSPPNFLLCPLNFKFLEITWGWGGSTAQAPKCQDYASWLETIVFSSL